LPSRNSYSIICQLPVISQDLCIKNKEKYIRGLEIVPQLVKGGKYLYSWSKVSSKGKIVIPNEAIMEYNLLTCDNVILMPGSKRSGGFGLTSMELLKNSALSAILDGHPELSKFQIIEGEAIAIKGKTYCWVKMNKDGNIVVPVRTLKSYGINPGDNLLSVRGSRIALGFPVRGPIIDEAKKHSNIEICE
jgi:bifunctional DNA-binding transcriptional regulator/antitoxin component of YhaV-PrlF toxin-antitoxin module